MFYLCLCPPNAPTYIFALNRFFSKAHCCQKLKMIRTKLSNSKRCLPCKLIFILTPTLQLCKFIVRTFWIKTHARWPWHGAACTKFAKLLLDLYMAVLGSVA